jgi:hypothetical protein
MRIDFKFRRPLMALGGGAVAAPVAASPRACRSSTAQLSTLTIFNEKIIPAPPARRCSTRLLVSF